MTPPLASQTKTDDDDDDEDYVDDTKHPDYLSLADVRLKYPASGKTRRVANPDPDADADPDDTGSYGEFAASRVRASG